MRSRTIAPFTCLAPIVGALLLSARAANAQRPLTGLWASDGYGQVFEFTADSLKSFEITKLSCIATEVFVAAPTPQGARAAYVEPGSPIVVAIKTDGDDRARMDVGFAASEMVIHRIPRKPPVCDTATPNTPRSNFDVFAATFAEHYPFFAERKVNWGAVVDSNRAKVTDATTPEALFNILGGMIAPMRDAHTSIAARSIGQSLRPVRQTPSFVPSAQRAAAYALVKQYDGSGWKLSPAFSFATLGGRPVRPPPSDPRRQELERRLEARLSRRAPDLLQRPVGCRQRS